MTDNEALQMFFGCVLLGVVTAMVLYGLVEEALNAKRLRPPKRHRQEQR